ncbi:MAG: bifunctional pyr operon transcriptional regulator/uracil phosphoribosyltransferase PyrR [Oscillospiraceae bacterium]|nr:bifunctional pyr operon transcriptional regulator/uracil phosphoribosyltransferase PyrR [Oscillospiraceae bacterium]
MGISNEKAVILDSNAMNRAIARISYEIIEKNKGVGDLCIIGIMSRGVELANRISDKIFEVEGVRVPTGYLDITLHRDDKMRDNDYCDKSQIDFEFKDKRIVLVDDVIYTGRSIRAAIDAIMSRERPKSISLAVLIDRGHRELPIRADYIGKNVPTSANEKVKVNVIERDGIDKVSIWS